VGIKLTGIATDRTIGAIAANEAVAKIKLYGLPPFADWTLAAGTPNPEVFPHTQCTQHLPLLNYMHGAAIGWPKDLTWDEFLYPTVADMDMPAGQERNTHWSALCYGISNNEIQVTVFVTRKTAAGLQYYTPTGGQDGDWPSPVPVNVSYDSAGAAANPLLRRQLKIESGPLVFNQTTNRTFFNDNVTIVANHNGKIYRVQEYKATGGVKDTLVLTEDWEPSSNPASETIWVVPPAVGSDRYPVIAVRQTTITIK
jgi:hypothetical protein